MAEPGEIKQTQFNLRDLRHALKVDNEFFINFCIPEQLSLAVPQFHIELVDLNTNPKAPRQAIAAPRGHSKTTMVKVATSKKIFFTHRRFFVYCTDTGPVAKSACRDIVGIVKSDNFKEVFGPQKWYKENDSEGLYIADIECYANLDKPYTKRIIIRALGAQQQVRGLNIDNVRPDDFTFDDAEDDNIINTDEQRAKYIKWLYGTAFKAGATGAQITYIGNLIDQRCALQRFLEDPDWFSVKYGCIKEDGTPLWPEKFSISELQREYREYKRQGLSARWFAEMMNTPMPEGLAIIKIEDIEFRPLRHPSDLELGFITIDPSIGQKSNSNKTAIVVHGFVENRWQNVEVIAGIMDPITMFHQMVKLCAYWRITLVGIESAAFQASLQWFFPLLLGQYAHHGINIVPLEATTRKTERILAWVGWLKDKTYVLNENEHSILVELLAYDVKKKENADDIIDSCAYGPQMIQKYIGMSTLSLDNSHVGYADSLLVSSL